MQVFSNLCSDRIASAEVLFISIDLAIAPPQKHLDDVGLEWSCFRVAQKHSGCGSRPRLECRGNRQCIDQTYCLFDTHGILERLTPADFLRHKLSQGQHRLVFVATAGGGIQAAAWTVEVLAELEDERQRKVPQCDFQNSVAVISSVSGGSLGSMVYAQSYSAERAEREAIEEFRRARALARLLVVPGAVDGIGRLLRQIHEIDPSTCSVDEFGASQALINDARDRVVETGKRELGLS